MVEVDDEIVLLLLLVVLEVPKGRDTIFWKAAAAAAAL
jgi:type IV secretory pathway VirB3-like protein